MLRDKRLQRRKTRFITLLIIVSVLLAFLLHRQITQRVFNPMIKGAYYRVDTTDKVVTLTFDVVWEPGETARILDILDRYHVQATFFLTGTWLRYNPDLAREILIRGHEIGHHGFAHLRLTELDDEALAKEFALMEEASGEELDVTTNLFRPPYGDLDQRVYDYATERGYTTVLWSINPHDWLEPGVDKIISRVAKQVHNGAIILLHSNASQSVDALPLIIQNLKMNEYEIVPFSVLVQKGRD